MSAHLRLAPTTLPPSPPSATATPPKHTTTYDSTAAAIHDGDPYIQGLAQAFVDAFEAEGGLVGTLNCDDFGDCGAARMTVVQNIGGKDNVEASMNNIVFTYTP